MARRGTSAGAVLCLTRRCDMTHRGVILALTVWLVAWPAPELLAVSQPIVTGRIEGLETCTQASCGSATFLGVAHLQVGTAETRGAFLVQATHEALPPAGEAAAITGGQWALTGNQLVLLGNIASGSL